MIQTSLLSEISERLTSLSDTPALDAAVLLAHIVEKPRTWVMAHPELALTPEQQERMAASLARLADGEPLPYVLGHWAFFGLEFEVTPDVLIPRPETELLLEKAIAWLQQSPERNYIADVGTGSGAIAIAIAVHFPGVHILATDISPQALAVARRNARKYKVEERIQFRECDLLPVRSSPDERRSSIDLVCANLPYIPSTTLRGLPIFGREPTLALDGGPDGTEAYRRLFLLAPAWLSAHPKMLVECESTQGAAMLDLARASFPGAAIELHKDLADLDRLLEITL